MAIGSPPRQLAHLQKSKVVCFAGGKGQSNQAFIFFSHDELSFEGVTLFLAAVVLFLFFCGR